MGSIFSKQVLFARLINAEEEAWFEADLLAFHRIFLQAVAAATPEPAGSTAVQQRWQQQQHYCAQQRRNDKTRRVLEVAFDPQWADNYIQNLLFDDPPPALRSVTLVPPVSGRRGLVVLAAALGTVAALSIWSWRSRPQPEPMAAPLSIETPQPRGVSALGRLNPAGNVRRLDAPSGAMGASPRVETLLVEEGDRVEAGQVLARFDTHPDQLADFEVAKATIASLEQRQALLQREVQRYERLLQSGAISAETLDVRKIKLLTVQQELRKAKAELQRRRIKLPDGELVAPFSGTVLEIFARPGERPGSEGVLSIGRSDQMEAVLEVYESDIGRVRVGQRVLLQSENGGFDGELQGRVRRIDPLVQQRDVLSTDPTADTDARVVEVHVSLDPADARRVRQLTGLKLIGRLQP